MLRRLFYELGRIRVRLLVVNLVVLLVPVAGLEFARLFERQLLGALERDMRNQAVLTTAVLEDDLRRGVSLSDPRHERMLRTAAEHTRMRVRVLDVSGVLVADSHEHGAPEGPEPPPPSYLPSASRVVASLDRRASVAVRSDGDPWLPEYDASWPAVEARLEVRNALHGKPSSYTRLRRDPPAVFLCVTEPVRLRGQVAGVVYVVRSTRPVLVELYRIRSGLFRILVVAFALTLLVTLALAWTISRPLGKLAKAAQRIASGERGVKIPVAGGGELRELGAALQRMTDQLDARVRYIEGFAADVAHEFKSPLTSIGGAAELLAEGASEDPVARARFLANIGSDVARLDRLVTRLLELSRIEATRTEAVVLDLEALLRRVIARYDAQAVRITLAYTTRHRLLRGREVDLETAFKNLVDNAVRFSPPDRPVEMVVTEQAQLFLVAVRDHGPGVPEENRAKIFERFFTTDADRRGTGLGLAIVRSVALTHGGTVTLAASQGPGATFIVTLPRLPS